MKKIYLIALMLALLPAVLADSLTLSNLNVAMTAGSTQTFSGTLTNTGAQPSYNITLAESALVSGSNTINPSQLATSPSLIPVLFAGQSIGINITVSTASTQPSGVYDGTISVSSSTGPATNADLKVTINPTNSGPGFTISETDFGSSDQERDTTTSAIVHIVNTGTQAVTVVLSSTLSSNFQLQFANPSVFLNPGSSADVQATIFVPTNQNYGKQSIGTITGTANGISASGSAFLTAKSELEISRIHVTAGTKTKSMSDGDTMDVDPGVSGDIQISVRNDFAADVDIRDVVLRVSGSGDIDLSEDTDLNDLHNGEKDTQDFSFDIPSDANNNQDITITVTGIDVNGAKHSAKADISLDVRRQSHDIKVDSFTLNPPSTTCNQLVTASMTIDNVGDNDESQTTLIFRNDQLGLYQRWSGISLNQGDTTSKTYTFTLLNNTLPGQYVMHALTYYQGDLDSEDELATLTVNPCTTTANNGNSGNGNNGNGNNNGNSGNTGNTGNNGNYVPAPVIIPQGSVGPSYGTSNFFNTQTYVIVLVAAVVILLLLIIVLLIKFVF